MQITQDGTFQPILQADKNCWCIEEASRASVIVDTADYFAAFAEACRAARQHIFILGWDFDRHEKLHRDNGHRDLPDEIGAFLVALVKKRPHLKVYLLSWDFNMIYAAERELLPALRLRLQAPLRFHFRLDNHHPAGASQHQKVVVIDDCIAFVGGIDLSRWRWDTPEHAPEDPRRIDPNGKPYPPFHDMMMLVEGKAAARLAELARVRWRRAHGWKIKPLTDKPDSSPWPETIEPQLHAVPVAIARTEPAYKRRPAIQEVQQLYLDAIASACNWIYIENQYFTSRRLADALIERLQEEKGPEVIIILPQQTGGWLEQVTMDVLRGRMVKLMQQADKHNRLRIYYPYQPGLGDTCISVHAKLLIVDDRLLRIGSSNTSNRSMGLDSECDLAIEARDSDDNVQSYIRKLRRQLMGEHLDCQPDSIARAEEENAGLIATIESLQDDQRSLRTLDCSVSDEVNEMVPDTGLIDPSEPYSPDYFVTEYVPKDQRSSGRRRLIIFLLIVVGLLGMAAAWRWSPLQQWLSPQRISEILASIPSDESRAAIAITGFVLASLLMVPLTLLAVIGGIVFNGWLAFTYIMSGALISSGLGFIGGRLLGRDAAKRLSGSRMKLLNKRLSNRGVVAVALLRLVPIAPFAIFNLVAGASPLGFRKFLLGSLLGLAPGLAAITLFSNSLWGALKSPSLTNVAIAAAVGVGLLLFAWLAKRWLSSA